MFKKKITIILASIILLFPLFAEPVIAQSVLPLDQILGEQDQDQNSENNSDKEVGPEQEPESKPDLDNPEVDPETNENTDQDQADQQPEQPPKLEKPVPENTPSQPAITFAFWVVRRGFIDQPSPDTVYNIKKGTSLPLTYKTAYFSSQRTSKNFGLTLWYEENGAWKTKLLTPDLDYTINITNVNPFFSFNSQFTSSIQINTTNNTFQIGKNYWIQYMHSVEGDGRPERKVYSELVNLNIVRDNVPAKGIHVSSGFSETFILSDNNHLSSYFSTPDVTDTVEWSIVGQKDNENDQDSGEIKFDGIKLATPSNFNTFYEFDRKHKFFKSYINDQVTKAGVPINFRAVAKNTANIGNITTVTVGGLTAKHVNPNHESAWSPSEIAFAHLKDNLTGVKINQASYTWEFTKRGDSKILTEAELNSFGITNTTQTVTSFEDMVLPELKINANDQTPNLIGRLKFNIDYETEDQDNFSRKRINEEIYSNYAQLNVVKDIELVSVPYFYFETEAKRFEQGLPTILDNEIEPATNALLKVESTTSAKYYISAETTKFINSETNEELNFQFVMQIQDKTLSMETPTILYTENDSFEVNLSGLGSRLLGMPPHDFSIDHTTYYHSDITWRVSIAATKVDPL